MPKLLNFKFPEGFYFFNCDNTEPKRSSKIFFFCFRRASRGGSRLSHLLRKFLNLYFLFCKKSENPFFSDLKMFGDCFLISVQQFSNWNSDDALMGFRSYRAN